MSGRGEIVVASGDELAAHLDAPTAALPSADVAITTPTERLGIERKAWGDLVSSYHSGRLHEQLRRMCVDYDSAILLIEGAPQVAKSGRCVYYPNGRRMEGVSLAKLMATLLMFQSVLGILVVVSPSPEASAKMIVGLCDADSEATELRRTQQPPKADTALKALTWMPGVGEELAKRLLEKYGTAEKALKAALGGKVDGVRGYGEGKAHKLRQLLKACTRRRLDGKH